MTQDKIWAWPKDSPSYCMASEPEMRDASEYLLATPAREAADDMLEALQQLLIEYDEVDLAEAEPESFTAAVISARAAIARATGAA